ncbi:unnamed protein product [Blepharisma stoltei]|uniref:Aspartate aminotransferase n=1 Tax=Blepharisma stoltei TaxID=1481888 RepID=A0AAU9IYW3_9CILI|nr:unnamed protein product [Blepharisma stoltei]
MSSCNKFSHLVAEPLDPINLVIINFAKNTDPKKVMLGVGAYRNEELQPHIFNAVKEAEKRLIEDENATYEELPPEGHAEFNELVTELLLGKNNPAILENRVASVQCLGGTGSLRVGAEFIKENIKSEFIYFPDPTWPNHYNVFGFSGAEIKHYHYWNSELKGLDLEGFLRDLNEMPTGSIVLLHACAHNPTGVDPTQEDWERIIDVICQRDLMPYFDAPYIGFASGDFDRDTYAIKRCIERGLQFLISLSFGKNFGLYGDRIGSIHAICQDQETKEKVQCALGSITKSMFGSGSAHGARIVATILKDPELRENWLNELISVSQRMQNMRKLLYDELVRLEAPGNWLHIKTQIGMFCYTGLTPQQCENMIEKWHCFMLKNGRMAICGLNTKNVGYVAQAFRDSLNF